MSINWKSEWEEIGNSTDIFTQLGRNNFSFSELILMLKDINNVLSLKSNDNLLDIGCANGLVSGLLSPFCNTVLGIDFSNTHIAKAREAFKNNMSLSFIESDILDFDYGGFNKILINAVFQYLEKDKLPSIFDKLIRSETECVFIGHVPKMGKMRSFLEGYSEYISDPIILKNKLDIWHNHMTWYNEKDFDIFKNTYHVEFLEPSDQLIQYKYCLNVALHKK
jgi:SAM-dependent methyltransferase